MNFFSLFKRKLIYNLKKKISVDKDELNLNSLDALFHHYGSDKANIFKSTNKKGHGYSKFYEKNLEEFREKNINILEIGSYAGASAAAFTKYFPKSNIFCLDINISTFKYWSKKIHVFGVDIKNEKKLNLIIDSIIKKHKISNFDIVIDDGSHNLSDILIGLKFLFKFVKNNGLYIIEDFKHPNYYSYNRNIDHIFIDEILSNIKNNKIFYSNIIKEKEQIDLIKTIKKIEIYKGNLKDSDIGFIKKK